MSIKKEALWVFSSTGISAVSQLLILALLAKSADVSVLGELAIINVVLALAFLLQDMGLSSYFIHRQSLSKKEESTLFAINVCLGCTATLIVLLAAYPVGWFYESESISSGLILVAYNFILIGATSQYQAHFIKVLKNDVLAKVEISSKLTLLVFCLYFVLELQLTLIGYLYAVLIASVVKLSIMIFIVPKHWHPRLAFDKKIIKPALAFGGYQMGSQVINQLRTKIDQIVIGKWLGIEALGIYSLAKELVMQPTKLITPITSKLVLPRLAKLQNANADTANIFNQASQIILIVNMVIYATLTVALYFIIPRFLDEQYSLSFSIFTLLLLIGLLRPIGSLFGALAQSQGASKVEFNWNILSAVVSVFALLLALPFNTLEAFAVAMVASQLMLSSYAAFFFSKNLPNINRKKHLQRIVLLTIVYIVFNAVIYY